MANVASMFSAGASVLPKFDVASIFSNNPL
jgi:hypothetical protein